MKKVLNVKYDLLLVMMVVLVSSLFTACKKDDKPTPKEETPNIQLGIPDEMSVAKEASTHNIVFTSNTDWEATTDADWITLDNASGKKGEDTLVINIAANSGEERSGKVTITSTQSDDATQEIAITQANGISPNFFVKEGKSGEGHSWDDATDLQSALENVAAGDTIFVAAGTYAPSKTITGGDDNEAGDQTFEIDKNITLIGGYPANATKGASADAENNETTLSGDLGNGSTAYHVVSVTAEKENNQTVTIKGFTITDGDASGSGKFSINGVSFYRNNGGGFSIGKSTVTIENSKIIENNTDHAGGGLFINNGDVTIKNTQINDNTSNGNSGGMWIYNGSKVVVYNSEVNRNSSATAGGTIYVWQDGDNELTMYNTKVQDNTNSSFGAGVYFRAGTDQGCKGMLVNCLITGNTNEASNGGGGVLLYGGAEVAIISSTITGNEISKGSPNSAKGGGIYGQSGSNNLILANSIVSGNSQASSSSDIDAKSNNELDITIVSDIIGSDAYDADGDQISGVSFDANSDFTDFVPTGSSNPALTDGIDGATLSALASQNSIPAEDTYLKADLNGVNRSEPIMGALVQ